MNLKKNELIKYDNSKRKPLDNKELVSKENIHIKTEIISKYVYFSLKTTIILLIIAHISCESYIILKINKKGIYNVLYKEEYFNAEGHSCESISMHTPDLITINDILLESPYNGEVELTKEENTIKLYYPETKKKF